VESVEVLINLGGSTNHSIYVKLHEDDTIAFYHITYTNYAGVYYLGSGTTALNGFVGGTQPELA
jgi:hypothetical protein